jgi:ribose transport system substrate-binding protein
MGRVWKLAVLVMVVALGFGAAACGSDDDSTSAGGDKGGGGNGQVEAFDTKIDGLIEEASAPTESTPPTSGPEAQAGKTVAIIPCAEGAEGCKRIADAAEQAAKAIGWKVLRLDGGGTPDKMGAAIRDAITGGADAMTLIAIDSSVVSGPLRAAKKAGISLVGVAAANPDGLYEATLYPGKDNERGGYMVGAALYQATDRDLKLVGMLDDSAEPTRLRNVGIKKFISECQEAGGKCEIVGDGSFTIPDLTTRLPQLAVNAARQSADANAIWVSHDAGMSFVVPALKQAGLDDLVGGATDGNAANLKFVRDGDIQQFDWSYPLEWTGYATIDQINRLLAGEKIEGEAVNQGMAPRLITPDNVPESGVYNGETDVVPLYEEVWGN